MGRGTIQKYKQQYFIDSHRFRISIVNSAVNRSNVCRGRCGGIDVFIATSFQAANYYYYLSKGHFPNKITLNNIIMFISFTSIDFCTFYLLKPETLKHNLNSTAK